MTVTTSDEANGGLRRIVVVGHRQIASDEVNVISQIVVGKAEWRIAAYEAEQRIMVTATRGGRRGRKRIVTNKAAGGRLGDTICGWWPVRPEADHGQQRWETVMGRS